MGEFLRCRKIKYKVEDTTKTNPEEAEHIHFYYEGIRYRAFIDRKNKTTYMKDNEVPRRVQKAVRETLVDNYNFIIMNYDRVLNDDSVVRVNLDGKKKK